MTSLSTTPLSVQNWDDLNKQYPNPSMLKLVLQSFLKHHGNSPEEIRTLVKNGDAESMCKLAHKLKGAACMMRANTMIELAEAVENLTRETGKIEAIQGESIASAMDTWIFELNGKLQTL